MLNKNKPRFRSYTDVNNYNNFLLELDKKNKADISISIKNNNIKKIIPNSKHQQKNHLYEPFIIRTDRSCKSWKTH